MRPQRRHALVGLLAGAGLAALAAVTWPRPAVRVASGQGGPVLQVETHGWLRIQQVVVEGRAGGDGRIATTSPWVSLASLADTAQSAQIRLRGYAWGVWPYQWQTTVRLAQAPSLLSSPPFIANAAGWVALRWSAPITGVRVTPNAPWQLASGGRVLRVRVQGPPGSLSSLALAVSGKNTATRSLRITVQRPPWLSAAVSPNGLLGAQQAVVLHWNQPLALTPAHVAAVRWIPATDGTWQAVDASVWRFLPALPWREGKTYTLVINPTPTLKSSLGMPLRQPLVWQFVGAEALAPLYWIIPDTPKTVYVTFDGGEQVDSRVLQLMRRDRLPFTTFLSGTAARAHPAFWSAWLAAGGSLGDGTYDRRPLTALDFASAVQEWTQALAWFPPQTGRVRLGRPPGGLYNDTVRMAATAAGLKALILWSAVLSPDGHIETWNGKPLSGGEIVRVEWSPDVARALASLLAVVKARHLHIGSLAEALAGPAH